MTQEDLLCDVCRGGCNVAFGDAGRAVHLAMVAESFKFSIGP
jgi:hypothetical protein